MHPVCPPTCRQLPPGLVASRSLDLWEVAPGAVSCRVRQGPEIPEWAAGPRAAEKEASGTPARTSCLAIGSPAPPGALPA